MRARRRANPELFREYDKRNYEKNKPAGSDYQKRKYARRNKEKAKEDRTKWRAMNPDKERAYWVKKYAKSKDKIRAYVLQWVRDNPEAAAAARARRRARDVGAKGTYTREDVRHLLKEQERLCFYCGSFLKKFHVDHFIPLAKGGSNFPSNLRISCETCNCSKGDKMPWEWKPERFSEPSCETLEIA